MALAIYAPYMAFAYGRQAGFRDRGWSARARSTTRRPSTATPTLRVPSSKQAPLESTPMHLPVNPPLLPMLAKRVDALPEGDAWIFEPKWDGFRALVFRDGDEVFIQSRDEKPLDRYFPEVVETLLAQLPARCVLDGEIVIARDGALDFEALQLRLHPAASRVKLLAKEIPASVVFFDLLCEGDRSLLDVPFRERRAALESILAGATPPIHLTPATK